MSYQAFAIAATFHGNQIWFPSFRERLTSLAHFLCLFVLCDTACSPFPSMCICLSLLLKGMRDALETSCDRSGFLGIGPWHLRLPVDEIWTLTVIGADL
jgi:hypothetical protein